MTTDRIFLRQLRLRTKVGVREWERKHLQDLVIDITIEHDRTKAGQTDRIEDAVDYKVIKDEVVKVVEGSSYRLIESLAEAIAARCLGFDGVVAVEVVVDKPAALRFADSVAVGIRRP